MKVIIKYTSDATGKQVTKVVGDQPFLPIARVGDSVVAEGRPRSVSKRRFFYFGEAENGVWDNTYGQYLDSPDEAFVVVFLIG
jgi:hypothetical protein